MIFFNVKLLINIFLITILIQCHCYIPSLSKYMRLKNVRMTNENRWQSDKYSVDELKEIWDSVDKSLLSIGSKGIQESHKNSLYELLQQHAVVKVKISSDRLNTLEMAKGFAQDEKIEEIAELLECRKREFMFKRL